MSPAPIGLAVFPQGVGSTRNADLAVLLEQGGFATVLLDRHTSDDEDIDVAAVRIARAIDHIRSTHLHGSLPIGLIGGAVTPLAVARRTDLVASVVCFSARPDLLCSRLATLRTPTLWVAGSQDTANLRAMREAADQMIAPHRVTVISGATKRFDEPGALEEVAAAVSSWLLSYPRAARANVADLKVR